MGVPSRVRGAAHGRRAADRDGAARQVQGGEPARERNLHGPRLAHCVRSREGAQDRLPHRRSAGTSGLPCFRVHGECAAGLFRERVPQRVAFDLPPGAMTANGQRDRSIGRGVWGAAALYAVLTVALAYPLSVRPGETVFGDNPDTHFFLWTLAWDAHAFVRQPFSIFDANIYYPNRLTLAYSENQIGSAIIAAPIIWLTGNPVLAVNLVALLACVLCGVGAYVLARRIGLGAPAATVCGLVFAFAPARFVRTGQAHLAPMQWIPFTLASLHSYFDGGDRRGLRWAAAFFTLEALTTGHGAVFLTVAAVAFLVYRIVFGEPIAPLRWARDLGIPGALLLLPPALVYIPYWRVQVDMGLRRSLQDWAPTPESFLASQTHLQQWLISWMPQLRINETASAHLFPGYLPVLLAAIAVAARVTDSRAELSGGRAARPPGWQRALALAADAAALAGVASAVVVLVQGPVRWRIGGATLLSVRDALRPAILALAAIAARVAMRRAVPFEFRERIAQARHWRRERAPLWRSDATVFYAGLTVLGFLLSMGPPLGLWPLVYWLPGFSFIRVASRFILLAMLGLAVLAGIGVERLAARAANRSANWLAAAIACLMIVEFAGMPLPVAPYRVTIPAIDRWLASRPAPFAVAEFPSSTVVRYQTMYMLHSMAHWQKTIHGFSGFEPPQQAQLFQDLRGFPDELSLKRLSDLGFTYLIVHEELYPPADWAQVRARFEQFAGRLTLEHTEGTGRVYSLALSR